MRDTMVREDPHESRMLFELDDPMRLFHERNCNCRFVDGVDCNYCCSHGFVDKRMLGLMTKMMKMAKMMKMTKKMMMTMLKEA